MNKKAILIDDEIHICALLRLVLTSLGVTVAGEAWNGEEGLKLFNKVSPDLVLLDVNMPGMSGDEVLQKIKTQTPAAKVIILSSVNEKNKVEQIINNGADYYIIKDNNAEQIRVLLEEILSEFS